jgi:hypothetical protein
LVSCVFCNTFSFPGLLVHLSCLPSFVTWHQFAAGGTYLVPLPATLQP